MGGGRKTKVMSASAAADKVLATLSKDKDKWNKLLSGLSKYLEENKAGGGVTKPIIFAGERSKRGSLSSNTDVSGEDGSEDADVIVLSGDSDSEVDDIQAELDDKRGKATSPKLADKLREDEIQAGSEDKLEEAAESEDEEDESGSEDDESSEEDGTSESSSDAEESDSELDDEDDDDVDDDGECITIDDSDEEIPDKEKWLLPPKPMIPRASRSTPMICYRCPKKKEFKNRGLFLFHIMRHTLGENFSCPTCKQPFLGINLCAAHEIRVHETEISPKYYHKNDPVILAAKKFMEKTRQREDNDPGQHPIFGGSTSTGQVDEDDLAKDSRKDLDPDIDDERIVASTPFLAYRGPPVNHILECYEIQLNRGRPKSHPANQIARTAINIHRYNVEIGNDVDRLGGLSKRSTRENQLPGAPELQSGTSIISESADPGAENKHGRVWRAGSVVSFASSLSVSSTISSGVSPVPSSATAASGSALPENVEAAPVAIPSKSSSKKRKREDDLYARPVASPAMSCLSDLSCVNCNHDWMFDENTSSLLNQPFSSAAETPDSVPEEEDEPLATPQKKKTKRRKGRKPTNKKYNSKTIKISLKNPIIPYKPPAPLPDSSFTDKENFLYAAGLTNKIRLDLHLKRSVPKLSLPRCYVKLKRLLPQT